MEVRYVPPGQGETYQVLGGDIITIKVTGEQTGGAFALFETITPPNSGPPPHVHHREEETFYVLEGTFVFHIADRKIMAGAGSVLVAPMGVPHRFANVGDRPGKLIFITRPAGFEHFVRDFATLPTDQPPDVKRLMEMKVKHGVEIFV